MSEAEVERLPDPDLFRDAFLLSQHGVWTPSEMDAADALLLSLVTKFQTARRS